MSKGEAEVLIAWGRSWHSHVWIGDDKTKRDELIAHVNTNLNAIGFKLGRGWQDYDPVIRHAGKAVPYATIATWAKSKSDGGKDAAQLFWNWAKGEKVTLADLPDKLQELAIITHLAEVGRGYSSCLESELYPLLEKIVDGSKTWDDYKDYSPSLTYKEDSAKDWEPVKT